MIDFSPLGDGALIAPIPEGVDHGALLALLRGEPRVLDAVVTETHLAVYFDPEKPPRDLDTVIEVAPREVTGTHGLRVVHVRYDGEDLAEVARAARLRVDEVIAIHAEREYTVAMMGFLPGFAYLRDVDPRIAIPRRETPRPRVPRASVAIAGPYTGVYPFASPGGWHLLGTAVDFSPFDPKRGAVLMLGDRVRFEPVSRSR